MNRKYTYELRRLLARTPSERQKVAQELNAELQVKAATSNYDVIATVTTVIGVGSLVWWIMRRKPHDMGNRYVVWNRH